MADPRAHAKPDFDAIHRTLDGLTDSIQSAGTMRMEQQELIDGILIQVETQVTEALRTELAVIEKMMEKADLLQDGDTKKAIAEALEDLRSDAGNVKETREKQLGEGKEREAAEGSEEAEEESSDSENGLDLTARMENVTSAYSELQSLVQRRMQAKDQILLAEQDQLPRKAPFWKRMLGLQ